MNEKRYMISEVKKIVGVESHALRYWEEELGLKIPRNEMGHRYYTEETIQELQKIKQLKELGFQLRAIKLALQSDVELQTLDEEGMDKLREELNAKCMTMPVVVEKNTQALPTDKMQQFRVIMKDIIKEATMETQENTANRVIKEMDYMLRMQDEQAEERFKKLEAIIAGDDTGEEIAATYQTKKRTKGPKRIKGLKRKG